MGIVSGTRFILLSVIMWSRANTVDPDVTDGGKQCSQQHLASNW